MLPVEWIIFLIALTPSLLKALWEGKAGKISILFIILTTVASAIVGIILAFIDAFLSASTFTITSADLISYLFNAFVGAIIVPIAIYLTSIKLE